MISVSAPAKINWFLEITGKRGDGYHLLSTVFQTISLADRLTFAPAKRLTLRCSDSTLPTDESNLVMRAAVRLQHALGEDRGARITLRKVVPMGAGLGGGSSDAAAVLLTLPKLWNRSVSQTVLDRLAVGLGADVPFFLRGGLCSASGIGEKLRMLTAPPKTWIVLVYPGFGVATKGAYAKVRLPWNVPRRLAIKRFLSDLSHRREISTHLFNRFEELVFPDHPDLPSLKHLFLEAGATATMMSGSGSSVFGVVPSRAVGLRVLKTLRRRYPQSWLVHTV